MSPTSRFSLSALLWHVRRAFARGGIPGVTAGALLAMCVAAYLSSYRPAQREIGLLAGRLAAAEGKAKQPVAKVEAPAAGFASFLDSLGPVSAAPETALAIHGMAKSAGVGIEQAELRLLREPGRPIARYEMTFQVVETYPKVQAFVRSVLGGMPNVALEQITFQRQKVADGRVETQVRLVAYFKA